MIYLGVDGGADHKKFTDSERGTGWCSMETDDNNPDAPPVLLDHGQVVGGPSPWMDAMLDPEGPILPAAQASRLLVVEGFRLLNPRASIDPLEIVGMVRMWAAVNHKQCVVQQPSQRNLVDHDHLKEHGFWPGGAGHADTAQAIRHVLSRLLLDGHPGTTTLFFPDPDA